MSSTRQNKFAKLIQKEIGDLFQREGADFFGNTFVTVTIVRVSPDLASVKVYLSIFGTKDAGRIINGLNGQNKEIRKRMGIRLRKQVRHIPEFSFYLDDTLDYAEKMESVFKTIAIPPAEDNKE